VPESHDATAGSHAAPAHEEPAPALGVLDAALVGIALLLSAALPMIFGAMLAAVGAARARARYFNALAAGSAAAASAASMHSRITDSETPDLRAISRRAVPRARTAATGQPPVLGVEQPVGDQLVEVELRGVPGQARTRGGLVPTHRLGLPGQPAEAEELMVMRDIALARLTGARIHLLHLSTAGSVAMVAAAKAGGLPVSAEAAPHHFTLTDECCKDYDATFKVHPPLRTAADVAAVKAGLADGSIDAIATDHAPHAPEDKERPFDQAPPGMLGLEFALALAFTELVDGGAMSEADVLGTLSWKPAAIAQMADHGGPVEAGHAANLCIVDPAARWTVDASGGASRSRNVPYVGRELRGKVRHTVLFGEPVVIGGEAQR
jgi:hypothetical protein